MSINSVEISGNLTRDCETRQTQGGMTIHSFGVAVNERRQNPQTQEWEDKPNFVDCVLFDRNGNKQWIANALRKGFKVFVRGKLSYSSWTDRDTGKNRSKLEVVVNDIDANWPPRQQAPQGYAAPQAYPRQGYQQPAQYQQQAPQGYGQPASAPQAPQAAAYPQQQAYAPQQPPAPQQQPPQQSPQPTPQQQPAPQPQQQQMAIPQQQPAPQAQAPAADVYDEDIPF